MTTGAKSDPRRCHDCGLLHVGRRACYLPQLREAVRGVALTAEEERVLAWLAGQDGWTVEIIVNLLDRLRRAMVIGEWISASAPRQLGEDGVRDPESPCDMFRRGEPKHRALCETDGHYLCDECVERASCGGGCGKRPSQCECEDGAATKTDLQGCDPHEQ